MFCECGVEFYQCTTEHTINGRPISQIPAGVPSAESIGGPADWRGSPALSKASEAVGGKGGGWVRSGEGCKILFSESIRERAVFNGVRGSRRHRASGALDPVKLSSPLLHSVGPSARSLEVRVLQQEASSIVEEPSRWTARQRRIARRGDSAMRARQQPVSCTLVPAAVSGLQEECCGGAKERGLQRIQCAGVVLSCPCRVGALRMICGQPVGRLCARLVT